MNKFFIFTGYLSIFILLSCKKYIDCKHVPTGEYKMSITFKNIDSSYIKTVTLNKVNTASMYIDECFFRKNACELKGYYYEDKFKPIFFNGKISKINKKKYKMEGDFSQNIFSSGQFYNYSGTFIITNE